MNASILFNFEHILLLWFPSQRYLFKVVNKHTKQCTEQCGKCGRRGLSNVFTDNFGHIHETIQRIYLAISFITLNKC